MVRSIFAELARAGLFQPLWSERIFDEWRIAVARKHGLAVEPEVVAAQAELSRSFPQAQVVGDPILETQLALPDPADAHVLAAAVAGQADMLLTFNLRDFPKQSVAGFGIDVAHPDSFLWQLLGEREGEVRTVVGRTMNAAGIEAGRQRSVLKRAKLSRFGKAFAA